MKIAIVADSLDARASFLADRLPARYMEDFSLLGLVVDRLDEALSALEESGYQFEVEGGHVSLSCLAPEQLPEIVRLLSRRTIHCEFSDIADTIYQA